ncbi:MAG: ATP-binding protein [Ignavibacteriaceae bacterium]|nr:ATP-binding protein [Ignavibacteriaceae bacterium]
MHKNIFNWLKGDRKYFTIVFFIIALILLSGIFSPVYIRHQEANWRENLSSKINAIQNSVTSLLDSKENKLLDDVQSLKDRLRSALVTSSSSYGALISTVNNDDFDKYSIEVLAPNGKLIAWNASISIPQNDIFPLAFPAGQVHFYNGDLAAYLTITDTVFFENDLFYFVVSVPVEKYYSIQNQYYRENNFSKELSEKYRTQFNIVYSPFAQESQDGRKYSFALMNKQQNKIGEAIFFKPSLDVSVDYDYQLINEIQALLIVLAVFFATLGFKNEFKKIKFKSVRLLILFLYCAASRMLLYFLNFPADIIQGPLADPAYFSSTLGNGILKSPIEFLVTALFALPISVQALRYLMDYINSRAKDELKKVWLSAGLFIPITFVFLLTIRGLSASVKSIIFDSTLRYFKEANLFPNLPSVVMNLNLLMLGTVMMIFLISYIILLVSLFPFNEKKKIKWVFGILFISYQIFGYIFIKVQDEPLITPLLIFIIIILTFILAHQIYFGKIKSAFSYIYITLIASFISITLLNYFNLELEKNSLRTTALEINRPNDNLIKFLLRETLRKTSENEELISDYYDGNSNFTADAFKLWANSSLQKETFNSSLNIWDKDQNHLGGFNSGIDAGAKLPEQFINYSDELPHIIEINSPDDSLKKIFMGIIPVWDRGAKIGYVTASIGFDLQNLSSTSLPDFLASKSDIINSVLDARRLKIFEFADSKLTHVYGDIYPSRDQIKPILEAKLSQDNDAWLTLSINNENFYTYILKTINDNTPVITAVSIREKRIQWDLFNFFKIFLIHSIFIIILLLVFFIIRIKSAKYTFRTQLLLAFLFISIIPVIILAVYNRQVIKQRTDTAVTNELRERLNYVENIINEKLAESPSGDLMQAFGNAGKDLGISYSVYEGSVQIFNSREQYYKAGLFTDKLNPEVYYQLNYLSYREYFTKENLDDFEYDSFYKAIKIGDREFIIGVNDAFNKVRLTYSVMDIDVFLFGIYSFATLIMIIISTYLANRISRPIRRLTKATASIAQGDLSVEVDSNVKGELKDLLAGFNYMTKELQRNQIEHAELERENAWKEMAKQVAHEIKNPLTPMKLAVQQLIVSYNDKSKNFDSIFEKVSQTILNQIENLSQIASEFSRFARMPNFKLTEIDLLPVIKDTVNLFVDEKIKLEILTSLNSALVEGDESQFRRLLINLIRNSIQAGANKITISLASDEEYFNLNVSDNGKGIPGNIKDKIFESNFTTKEKGMGLGLKLAKRFIEGINGSISLDENNGSGASFKISIHKLKKNI